MKVIKIFIGTLLLIGVYYFSCYFVMKLNVKIPPSLLGLFITLIFAYKVKINVIECASDFLTKNMTLFLIPPCASIVNSLNVLNGIMVQWLFITLLSTLVTMLVSLFVWKKLR